jgi:hypothetical protein
MSGSAITQAEKDKAQKILNEVIKLPDNKMCADCNSLGPRWASMNLGVRYPSPPSPPSGAAAAIHVLECRAARACVRACGAHCVRIIRTDCARTNATGAGVPQLLRHPPSARGAHIQGQIHHSRWLENQVGSVDEGSRYSFFKREPRPKLLPKLN